MNTAILIATLITTPCPVDHPIMKALAMVETGASGAHRQRADMKIGKNGEVTRYQILPRILAVEAFYTDGNGYMIPSESSAVARKLLVNRIDRFKKHRRTDPTLQQMYYLWSCPTMHITKVKRETSERFANLVEEFSKTK